MTTEVDEAALEQFAERLAGYMTGSMMCLSVWLGDELGLYRLMAGDDGLGAGEIAERSRCHPRLVREWLDSQVSGGLVGYDPATDWYRLSPEARAVLADDDSPRFMARAMNALGAMCIDLPKVADAFREDGGLAWGEHDHRLFRGTEWLFRTGYRAALPDWVDALDGVRADLDAGAAVADIGCGHGASVIALAQQFPAARIHGFDYHAPSIETARQRAVEAGVAGTTEFSVSGATSYPGTYRLICFFDCLHDMGDPVGVATYARKHLTPQGSVLLVEPFALPERVTNLTDNPMAALLYTASTFVCTPNSLSQEVGLGLGAQAGEDRLHEVFDRAGYTRFRKVAETPLNLILEARP
ncbi:class I SAM-dependent methyltransferase [Prescottella agglutinans]|uniref:SAM-dependent methyltransferase n=1 Tax=Prescottella agglutinans TaxID=1644129 RepID=A0ABT6M630_9NOCA|nr:class I SAM-dependent methyltransferase [Prescottella agglutinans]MDH6279743.1 SAM-dependent methyltransferase [Prescottella agglutinans]